MARLSRAHILVLLLAVVVLSTTGLIVALELLGQSSPHVAYLKLDPDGRFNIWIADPGSPEDARQVTFAENGVVDFDVSADGNVIAYSRRGPETSFFEIYLLDLRTDDTRQLTGCASEQTDCTAPAFRPDGQMIAYERSPAGADFASIGLIDLSVEPATLRPLFQDTDIPGYDPAWSANGERIAFYNPSNNGIIVHDLSGEDSAAMFVPSAAGEVGALSPDGTRLIFPEVIPGGEGGQQARTYLQLANLERDVIQTVGDPGEAADDRYVAWNPNGRYIAIGRRYEDERYTLGAQIYLLDLADGSIKPLVVDEHYSNGFFRWSPDGTRLVIQRFRVLDEQGAVNNQGGPEVWTYNIEMDRLKKIAGDAQNPQWVR